MIVNKIGGLNTVIPQTNNKKEVSEPSFQRSPISPSNRKLVKGIATATLLGMMTVLTPSCQTIVGVEPKKVEEEEGQDTTQTSEQGDTTALAKDSSALAKDSATTSDTTATDTSKTPLSTDTTGSTDTTQTPTSDTTAIVVDTGSVGDIDTAKTPIAGGDDKNKDTTKTPTDTASIGGNDTTTIKDTIITKDTTKIPTDTVSVGGNDTTAIKDTTSTKDTTSIDKPVDVQSPVQAVLANMIQTLGIPVTKVSLNNGITNTLSKTKASTYIPRPGDIKTLYNDYTTSHDFSNYELDVDATTSPDRLIYTQKSGCYSTTRPFECKIAVTHTADGAILAEDLTYGEVTKYSMPDSKTLKREYYDTMDDYKNGKIYHTGVYEKTDKPGEFKAKSNNHELRSKAEVIE